MESRAAFQDGRDLSVFRCGRREAGETVGRYKGEKGCFASGGCPGLETERLFLGQGGEDGKVRESARGAPAAVASVSCIKMSLSEGRVERGGWGRRATE